jgi:hypothetical protein
VSIVNARRTPVEKRAAKFPKESNIALVLKERSHVDFAQAERKSRLNVRMVADRVDSRSIMAALNDNRWMRR